MSSATTTRHPNLVLAAVCLLGLMSTVGVSMPYPILAPIFVNGPVDGFTHFAGLDPQVLMGVALAANPLGILLGSLVVGPMSDRLGRRRVLAATLSACLAFYLLTGAALSLRSYPMFVLARLATGLTEGNVAVARALLGDLGEDHPGFDRTRAFALLNACLYSGWLVGPLVGGWTLPLGEPVPFVIAAVMMLPCLGVLWVGLPDHRPSPEALASRSHGRSTAADRLRRWWRDDGLVALLRRDRTLAALALLHFGYTLGLNAMYEYAPLWMLENAGFSSRGIATVTAVQCALMTAASLLAGRFGHASSPRHPLVRAARVAGIAAMGLASLALLPGTAGLAMIAVLGVPTAFYNAMLPAWLSERFAAHGQGRVMGMISTIFCAANVVMALAGGWLALLSTRWTMGLGGLACLLAAAGLARLARDEARRDAEASGRGAAVSSAALP